MNKLNVVIVGAGFAGKELHVSSYQVQADVEVLAFCDPNLDRAKAVAQEKGVPYVYASLEEALNKHRVDIVSICSPPMYHAEQATEAMRAGANVLVEKPMVSRIQEADLLKAEADKTGRKLCVMHNYRFQDGIRQAVSLVEAGELGEILHLNRVWVMNGALSHYVKDQNMWVHDLTGGFWTETVAHDIYTAYQFIGPMELIAVNARKVNQTFPRLCADEVIATFRYDKGYFSVRYSTNGEGSGHKYMSIHGSKAMIITDGVSILAPDFDRMVIPPLAITQQGSTAGDLFNHLKNRKIAVFGTGSTSQLLVKNLSIDVAYYLDNNSAKWGSTFMGAPICGPDELLKESRDTMAILVASSYYDEISTQLGELGFEQGKHFWNALSEFSCLYDKGHTALITAWVKSVREDLPVPVEWEEAYMTMKLVEEVGNGIDTCLRV